MESAGLQKKQEIDPDDISWEDYDRGLEPSRFSSDWDQNWFADMRERIARQIEILTDLHEH